MLKILIVDDEFKSRELLKVLLNTYCEGVAVVATAADVASAIKQMQLHQPDLVLLDVEMGTETGFDLLEQVKATTAEIIFVTAHSHYALKAIKFSAMDYLLKPVNPEELKAAIAKVADQKSKQDFRDKIEVLFQNLKLGSGSAPKIALPTIDGLIFVPAEDIIYCQAEGAYTSIFVKGTGKICVSKNLKEYELLLAAHRFFRVHNSYLINLNEVKKYIKGEGGYVILSNDVSVDVSKRRKDAFLVAMAKG